MQEKSPEFWTAVGTAVGAIGSKLLFWLFKRNLSEADQIRKELREQTRYLEKKIAEVYLEVDEWRLKYYEQVEKNSELKIECQSLRREIEELKGEMHRSTSKG